ncbi:MAG: hypothetical protein HQK78_14040 [Desulfobacterales bacterium]|nr:hypothetical protein [Desulfobacterales bacterium]
MKKNICFFILSVFLAVVLIPNFAGSSSPPPPPPPCQTVYPIVLAHGIAMNDIDVNGTKVIDYFNNIKDALVANGATVFVAQVDKMAATGTKAYQFAKWLDTNVWSKGYQKVNIIGHSHGGIYTKYAMKFSSYTNSKYGTFTWSLPASKVASLTQIDSPNQGSPVADFLLAVDDGSGGLVAGALNYLYAPVMNLIFGNKEGDVYVDVARNGYDLTIDGAAALYQSLGGNNGIPGVYCQSYMHKQNELLGVAIPQLGTFQLMSFTMPIQYLANLIGYKGGPHQPSDGIVSEKSAQWANYRGMDDGGFWQAAGIDHCNATGLPFGWTGFFDAPAKYVEIVKDLKARGY